MLALYDSDSDKCDLSSVNDRMMLDKSKETLVSMAFFAINEFQYLSQILFEKTFNNSFKFDLTLKQSNFTQADYYLSNIQNVNSDKQDEFLLIKKIEQINHLDVELYKFAIDLFFKRLKSFKLF